LIGAKKGKKRRRRKRRGRQETTKRIATMVATRTDGGEEGGRERRGKGRATKVDWGGRKGARATNTTKGRESAAAERKDDGGDDCHNDGGENGRGLRVTRSEKGEHGRKRGREVGVVVACLRKGLVQACLQGDFIATSTMEAAGITLKKRVCCIICREQ
jgi:hypothetical protein